MWWDGHAAGPRDDEAEHVEWVPIEIALVRLAHRNERKLVEKALTMQPDRPQPPRHVQTVEG
jgi:hypothetical protein